MNLGLGNLLPLLKEPVAGRLGTDILQDVECDDEEMVQEWLDEPDTHVDDTERKRGQTALIFAARKGAVRCVEMLIAAGADLNIQAVGGSTAVYVAAQENQDACLKLIVAARPDLDAKIVGGATALHVATRNANTAAMRLLIDSGASLNQSLKLAGSIDDLGATPLSIAVFGGSKEAVEVLNSAGAPEPPLDRQAFEIFLNWKQKL
jgi:ankyrin repeat protein